MPHDKNGNELKPGDLVHILCVVKSVDASEDYCNVHLETVHGRKPDGFKENITAINAAVTELIGDPVEACDDCVKAAEHCLGG